MVEINKLSVIYPDKTKAVDKLSLYIGKGERVALVGANGAGKTTLMLALVGILAAAEGEIKIDGITLCGKTHGEIRSRVGFVFQNPDDQLFTASVYDDVAFGPRSYGLSEEEAARRVTDALTRLGIEHLCGRSALKLSGGEKRIAAIATILAMNPSVMLFDEPTAFLDLKARRTLVGLINDLPHTKLIASHDIAFIMETCERVVLIKKGAVCADGAPREIFSDEKLMRDCDL